jgi:hypothetical protein
MLRLASLTRKRFASGRFSSYDECSKSILPEHRRAVDFLSQNNMLVAEPFFGPLLVVDIGRSSAPAHDLAAFVFERIVLNELWGAHEARHLVSLSAPG